MVTGTLRRGPTAPLQIAGATKDVSVATIDTRGRGGNSDGRDGGGAGARGTDTGLAVDANKDSNGTKTDRPASEVAKDGASSSDGRSGDGQDRDADANTSRDTAEVGPPPFVLTSSAFKQGEAIPLMYRCMQQNVSPPLRWTPGPVGTKSYAVILLQAGMPIRWQLWDIPANVTSLPMNVVKTAKPPVPPGSKQTRAEGTTGFGYNGPCPVSAANSTFVFVVYALKDPILPNLMPLPAPRDVTLAIQSSFLGSASLSGISNQ